MHYDLQLNKIISSGVEREYRRISGRFGDPLNIDTFITLIFVAFEDDFSCVRNI